LWGKPVFHPIAYSTATGGSVTDQDVAMVADPVITQRNSHAIVTAPWNLIGAAVFGPNMTRVNIQYPTIEALGRHNVWPVMKSATVPSPPLPDLYLDYPIPLGIEEEIQVKQTDTASETPDIFLFLADPGWNRNIPAPAPQFPLTLCMRFTATITIVAHGWSALSALTMEKTPYGGTYSIIGAELQGTNVQLFRLIFPSGKMYNGRILRPGWLAQNAIGDQPMYGYYRGWNFLGEWGRFHTSELPQIEIYGATGGSQACEGRLWVRYMGRERSLLNY
jgi:hypothetical protein